MDAPRFARGMAAPASATAPPLARRGAACAGGWPSSPCRHAFGVHGWAPGGTRSRCARSPRGPVPCGQSGPREDRRGSSRRSAALFRPAGFGWGRARRCGTRQPAASPTPPPIRARPDTLRGRGSLTRVVQIRRNGGFPTPLVRPRLPRPFFGQNRSLLGLWRPPRLNFARHRLVANATEGHAIRWVLRTAIRGEPHVSSRDRGRA